MPFASMVLHSSNPRTSEDQNRTRVLPVLLGDVQSHHDERFNTLHHPAQPLAHFAHFRFQEIVGHAAPDDRGQHLDVQPGGALWDGIVPFAAEHGC